MPLALAQRVVDAGCRHAIAVTRYSVTVWRCAVDALHAREVVAWKENVVVSASAGRTLRCGTSIRRRR
ncbi:hypothetical protein XabCFBP2524_17640 [Xanthomonas axonopodis pv. begoniae]|nr:hypothetical protein XabCFBP2524_17640 [Xanthomonas axonopodis pv. begoniae]